MWLLFGQLKEKNWATFIPTSGHTDVKLQLIRRNSDSWREIDENWVGKKVSNLQKNKSLSFISNVAIGVLCGERDRCCTSTRRTFSFTSDIVL